MASRPLLVRLVLPYTLILALIVTVSGVIVYREARRSSHRQQIQNLESLSRLLRQWVPAGAPREADMRRLDDTARALNARVTLIDGSGGVLFDSNAPASGMDNHND